ncbi:MAG: tRNA 2-thiouridine(34) synthase MnmA [Armatimonadetes bacterium]|nr:tRNA 2-thiouridine(34) synthase MnmA [Armatimonadota bacterium]
MGNQHPERVAVAMSGGVDSSVTAALLRREGYDVVGFTMRLGSSSGDWEARNACCGLTEVHDARRVADTLGIPHYVLNQAAPFEKLVIDDFVDEYRRGRTPNPCIRCNQHIKFATFLDHARAFGCGQVATGHYARLAWQPERGRYGLRRGLDPGKDQSYVLHTLTQEQAAHTLLPLGGYAKAEVRAIAAELGLATAAKPDSQEICFVEDGAYADFVKQRAPEAAREGQIVTPDGQRLGTHAGIIHFTVGQRKGLGLAAGEPLIVSELRAESNEVVVEPAATAGRRRFEVAKVNWLSLAAPVAPLAAGVQVRYRMQPLPAVIEPSGELVRVVLPEPVRGVSPGQAAVFYDSDGWVLGGGTIARVLREEEGAR